MIPCAPKASTPKISKAATGAASYRRLPLAAPLRVHQAEVIVGGHNSGAARPPFFDLGKIRPPELRGRPSDCPLQTISLAPFEEPGSPLCSSNRQNDFARSVNNSGAFALYLRCNEKRRQRVIGSLARAPALPFRQPNHAIPEPLAD
jgi:hypothetical protein